MRVKNIESRRQPRLIVERDFQLRFTLKLCVMNGLLFALFTGLFLYFIGINYEMLIDGALQAFEGAAQKQIQDLQRERNFVVSLVVGALVFLIIILFLSGLYLTQQVAGPLFALKARLREFSEGRPKVRMHLRRGDEFKNLEEIFNFAMQRHEERRALLKDELDKVSAAIKSGDKSVIKKIENIQEGL